MSSTSLVVPPQGEGSLDSEAVTPLGEAVVARMSKRGSARFAQPLLNAGFAVALLLAAACLALGAVYLYTFLKSTNMGVDQLLTNTAQQVSNDVLYAAINARLVMARVALLSCGIFVGMAFGFLGFALFLIGVKGEMNVDAHSESYAVKIARMSPGVFVILCATILIGVCVSRPTPFSHEQLQRTVPNNAFAPTGAPLPKKAELPDAGADVNP